MSDAPIDGLTRPELARLWIAARQRLERNGRSITSSRFPLDELSEGEVAALCGLLGRRRPSGGRVSVSLAELDTALSEGALRRGLLETLEAIDGPVADRRAERTAARDARDALWAAADAHPASKVVALREWIDALRLRGRLARLDPDDPVRLLSDALDTMLWLMDNRTTTSASPLPLSALAAIRLGDGHALDPDRALGSLMTDAVTSVAGLDDPRAAWAAFGVQPDRVSTSALTFMLSGIDGGIAAAAAANAEPLRVTHRMLDRGFGLEPGSLERVWVCENPAIISLAADRLGTRCRPLVCTDGMPSTVSGRLLDSLRAAGAELRFHTDFDVGGIAIAQHLTGRFGAVPWRMRAADYLAALDGPTTDLTRTVGATPWDPPLSSAMNTHRRAVHEEAIFTTLLADLGRP